jgi:hypothetical protein
LASRVDNNSKVEGSICLKSKISAVSANLSLMWDISLSSSYCKSLIPRGRSNFTMKRILCDHLDFAISYNKVNEKHWLLAGGYRYLDHVTDAYVEAYGDSIEEAFSYAAKGTINVMFEINNIVGTSKLEFEVEGHDYSEL